MLGMQQRLGERSAASRHWLLLHPSLPCHLHKSNSFSSAQSRMNGRESIVWWLQTSNVLIFSAMNEPTPASKNQSASAAPDDGGGPPPAASSPLLTSNNCGCCCDGESQNCCPAGEVRECLYENFVLSSYLSLSIDNTGTQRNEKSPLRSHHTLEPSILPPVSWICSLASLFVL